MTDSCVRLNLDLQQTDMLVTVRAKRFDTGRQLRISLSDGGMPYVIGDDCFGVFTGRRADGTVIYNQCTIENNEILYQFTEHTCAAAGRIPAEIRLYSSQGTLITTASFLLEVFDGVCCPEETLSQDEKSALDALVLEMLVLKEQLSDQAGGLKTDESLVFREGVLCVNTTAAMEQDNTLPMSSAGVYATVGNIAQLLQTI